MGGVALFKVIGVLVVLGGIVVGALMQSAARAQARKRMLAGTPDVSDNALVTVTGTVRIVGTPLVAPLSGTECVVHSTRARPKAGPGGAYVRTETVRFVLVTPTGDVIVDAKRVELPIRPGAIVPRRAELERKFLRDLEVSADADTLSFDEIRIVAGQKIKVHGVARVQRGDGEAGYREAPHELRIVDDDQHPVMIAEA